MSIQIKVSKYIPKGFAVMVGTLCSKCKKPFDPLTLCVENMPYGHVPDVVILDMGESPTKHAPDAPQAQSGSDEN